ncbi:MAG: 1-acyl-sn-glycerol-3-phosphate acyltransferase [Luteibaculaceae bacterium]
MEKYIDVKKIFEEKNPRLAAWLPGFIFSYITKVIHQDEINAFMSANGDLTGLAFVDAIIDNFQVEVVVVGEENIPSTEPVIFASNHPLGGLDGIAFMHALGKYRTDLRFLVNDILTKIKNFDPLFVPVNKHGSQGKEAVKRIEDTYASTNAVLVFPAGLVSRKQAGGVADLEWKKSFISKAKKYQKPIVPVFIEGKNSPFFYNLSQIRKKLGIKANVEMFYLPDEMFRQKGKRITIYIGKALDYKSFDNSKTEQQWADYVKQLVYKLPKAL